MTNYCALEDARLANQWHQDPSSEIARRRKGKEGAPVATDDPSATSADRHDEQLPRKRSRVGSRGVKSLLDTILDQPCSIHSTSSDKPATHKHRNCWVLRQVAKGGLEFLDNPGSRISRGIAINHDQGQYPSEVKNVLMIYETHSS